MFVYLCFFCFLSGLIFFASRVPVHQSRVIVYIVFVFLIGFAGLRGLVGSDTISYFLFYEQFKSPEVVSDYLTKMEPVFVLLLTLHSNVIDNKFLYLLMMSVFQVWLLWLVYKRSGSKYLFLFCYVLIFYLNFHFNITRAAIAAMLLLVSLTSESNRIKVIAAMLAPGFHFSVLFFYPLFFTRMSLRYFLVLAVFLLVGLLAIYNYLDFFVAKYHSYESYMSGRSTGVSLAGTLFFINTLVSIFVLRKVSFVFLWVSCLLLLSLVVNEFYPIGYRLVTIGLLLYFYFLLEELSTRTSRLNYLFFWAPVFLVFSIFMYGLVNEVSVLEKRIAAGDDLENSLHSTYIPYEFYWADEDVGESLVP
ncbi:EpsG family protein [Pseudomonas sp. D(2018)]|uniref:EpsG family protein n=1 Tax=Pseudomonas sp. D(2018) TaxID=2502238 RepID=UPI0010F9FF34|nr:EpsG family protein [Pseudomonas sp. D(2018)]